MYILQLVRIGKLLKNLLYEIRNCTVAQYIHTTEKYSNWRIFLSGNFSEAKFVHKEAETWSSVRDVVELTNLSSILSMGVPSENCQKLTVHPLLIDLTVWRISATIQRTNITTIRKINNVVININMYIKTNSNTSYHHLLYNLRLNITRRTAVVLRLGCTLQLQKMSSQHVLKNWRVCFLICSSLRDISENIKKHTCQL